MSRFKLFMTQFISIKTGRRLLEVFGILWVVLKFSSFFSPNAANFIRPYWWAFLTAGFLIAGYQSWPRFRRRHQLQGRDVQIEIVVGDIFDAHGDMVIGSNTSFDTDTQDGLISPSSIQGQFSAKHFKSRADLDRLLDTELSSVPYVEVDKRGKNKRYPIGTVCRVPTDDYTSYWVAIADLNEFGTAKSNFQTLRDVLPSLWEHISQKGTKSTIRMPILGSGFSRIGEPRGKIVKEIIRSFIASCSECSFCDHLTICIHPNDFSKYSIDIEDLDDFLKYQCLYTEFSRVESPGHGTEIG